MFEAFAIEVLKASRCVEAASKVLHLSWSGTYKIIERGVVRGIERRDLTGVKRVGIDETSFLRGQSYIASLCDLDGTRVLEVVEGRKEENARALLWSLPGEVRGRIEAIAMDM